MRTFRSHKNRLGVLLSGLIITVLLSACIVDPHSDHVHDNNYSASEEFSYVIDVENRYHLDLDGINGTVEITGGGDMDQVEIWGERRVESDSKDDARSHLRLLSVEIIEEEEALVVWTKQPKESYGRNYLVFYHVRIPRNWMVSVTNVNGAIFVETMENTVTAEVTNGEIALNTISGNSDVKSVNGNINMSNISGSVKAALTNGNISGTIYLPPSGAANLSTVNGQIILSIPRSTSANFAASVSNGTISLTNLNLNNSSITPTSVTGILGDGDGQIELKTVNGNIVTQGF